jgi:hypothetical protein
MSLTKILDIPSTKVALKALIRKPAASSFPILAPRLAEYPPRVGIAFDYALRFGLAARGWATLTSTVAEAGVSKLLPPLRQVGQERLDRSLAVLRSPEVGQGLTEKAAAACYVLGGLDIVWRARLTDQVERDASRAEIEDLLALWSIVPWDSFRPAQRLLLNPSFGVGSKLVDGADADLVLDDCLIEVKTVAENRVDLDITRQLVGYALLARRFGLEGKAPNSMEPIRKLGVYWARAGRLVSFDLDEVCRPADQERVMEVILSAAPPQRGGAGATP